MIKNKATTSIIVIIIIIIVFIGAYVFLDKMIEAGLIGETLATITVLFIGALLISLFCGGGKLGNFYIGWIIPTTILGKLSIVLVIFYFLLNFFYNLIFPISPGVSIGVPPLSIVGIITVISGCGSFILGIIAVAIQKERAIFVFLSILVNLFTIALLLEHLWYRYLDITGQLPL